MFNKNCNTLLNLEKNHYDPHEPHSALNKEIESLTKIDIPSELVKNN